MNEDGSWVCITPISYIEAHKATYDGELQLDHLLPEMVDPNQMMEGCYEYVGNPVEVRQAMLNAGFQENELLTQLMKQSGSYDELAYSMAVKAAKKASAKLSSGVLKKVVVAQAIAEIGSIMQQFSGISQSAMLQHVSSEDNWKRISKRRTENGEWERIFDCKPLDDQLRAYVITDSTDARIVSINIQGE